MQRQVKVTDKHPDSWRQLGFPQALPHPDWEPCYIRFGRLPPGGRSYAYQVDARTGETCGYYENGVGVFKGYRTPEKYLLDLEYKVHLAAVYVRTRNRPAYLVEGDIVGYGAAS